ncbi:tetratricopeptide repeat protein [Rhodopirellula baltica]
MDQDRIVDSVDQGQVLSVLQLRGDKVLVSRGRPGWIDASALVGLEQAEDEFAPVFRSGAGPRDYLARGNVRIALSKFDAGLEDLRKAVSFSGDPTAYLPALGFGQLAAQQQPAAIESFTKALQEDAKSSSALMGRGLAYYQVGQLENALTDLNAAIQLEPEHAFPRKYAGATLHDLGRLVEAKSMLDSAVAIDPSDGFTRRALGRLLFDQGELTASRDQFRMAVELAASDVEALTGCGVVGHVIGDDLQQVLKDYQQAIRHADESLENAHLWSNLGQVQSELGQLKSAVGNFNRAIQLDERFLEARSLRAHTLLTASGATSKAIELAKSDLWYVFQDPGERTFWDYRALAAAYSALGDSNRAVQLQRKAMALIPKANLERFASEAQSKLEYYAAASRGKIIQENR